ncbi:MAG: hypothetical protein A2Y25_10050 [Candidatus Melainabacteria bacterium GWF2_37_15]|nr:MAG: hypothetical protein A2Y25_10050 [Candidatus Melainabacteria bacterium GWF2_37_15]
MKAIVYKEKNKVTLENIPIPEIKENGAIIKVRGCGLCGSDIVKLKQGLVKEGTVLGHEVVGELNGERVVLGHHVPCFDCVYCKNESYSMCAQFKETNIIPGGFAEYIFVSEKHLKNTVFKVPDEVSDIEASFTEPAACCLRAVKRAGIKPGDNVLVVGLGSIGLIMGQILKYYGANVTGCDLIEKRLEIAKGLGFRTEAIKEADKVFLTAGSNTTVDIAISSVRDGGTILVFASVLSDKVGFPNNEIYYRELTVMGSYSPSPSDLREALDLIAKKIIKVDKLFNVYDMIEIENAINDTISNKIIKAYIVIS